MSRSDSAGSHRMRAISSPRRDGIGVSGHVEHEGQFVRDAELGDQSNEGLAQVRDRGLTTVTFAVGADARTQLGMSTPNAVFALLDGIGEMYWGAAISSANCSHWWQVCDVACVVGLVGLRVFLGQLIG